MTTIKEFFMPSKFISIILLLFALSGKAVYSQDGESLFKANCSACHNIDKVATGPALQGARQRWIDYSSEEQFYQWIFNSKKVIESGDPYALKLFNEFNQSVMTPQNLSKEEIDAVFEYVENPPVKKETSTSSIDFPREPIYVEPDLSFVFWSLLATTIILMISIGLVGASIKTLLKSEKFKNRPNKKANEGSETRSKTIKTLLVLIGLASIPSSASAFQFDMTSTGMVEVNSTDIWIWVCINIILIWVLLYLRKVMNEIVEEINPKPKTVKVKSSRKVLKVLTRTVDVENEETILMDHEYDGIQELDNNLPPWWLWGFYISIVYAFLYMGYYHILNIGDSQVEAYEKEMVEAKIARDAWLKNAAMNVDENTATFMSSDSDLGSGARVFKENCKVCHGESAEGLNGPNLTDDYWIYGNDIKTVFTTIKYGRGDKAEMPPHIDKLNPVEIQQVASYIMQLDYVASDKSPEGNLMEDAFGLATTKDTIE